MNRLAIFDFDGTLLRGNSWHEFFFAEMRRHPARAPLLASGWLLRRTRLWSGPRLRALATCEAPGACRDPVSERMSFVDQHQAEFAQHGFCARTPGDPAFDRECFLENGDSFESNPSEAATDPLRCRLRAREFRPYSSRARWIRTANDSYFTAMTFPEGISGTLQPSDLHDATWGATSAVYGGAVHPSAEGHAAMADAAMPVLRPVLGLASPQQVRAEPLAPLQIPAAR